jgi:serine/threonine protein kinase
MSTQKKRKYLKKNILLCGESDGERFKRTFIIEKKIGEGSSAVSYEAYHGNSGRGVLKEFYPDTEEAYSIDRDAKGQLFLSERLGDAKERFMRAEREYIEPYEMLLDAKQNGVDQELATFIPAFEIYHGCDEDGNIIGTTYIWSPEPKLETFDKACEEIHKHPSVKPERKLVTVLRAIESLAKCICALHAAGMLHLDIKPSNFGFLKRGNETLTQTLSMFDINSVCSVYHKPEKINATPNYIDTETEYKGVNNQTDIYSIGATLFHAIIVSDETKERDYLYQCDYYDRLREMVDDSRLIRASEANSHPRLRNILTVILRKSLCERADRYANCEELLEDLAPALYYALPSDISRKSRAGEEWVLKDVEKSLDRNKNKNSSLAIQYHLYKNPLYNSLSEDESTINVLLVGFGNYGQKFLDECLQAGQIRGKSLNVTVISDDIVADMETYLSERPELAEFFNVNGSLPDIDDTYGSITFEISKLSRDANKENANILQNILYTHYETKRPHYVFIALGEDDLNFAAAKACKAAIEVFEMNCIVNFVCEDGVHLKQVSAGLCPVYVNKDIEEHSLYPEIERMAFNTHLIWEKNLNVDYRVIKSNFRKTYNHDSCVANVLSLKYKLYSIGIDLEQCSFDEAARLFAESGLIKDKKCRDTKNELIWVEHRRWVTEKLCHGWSRIRKLEDCMGGVTKDEKRKRHVCILRSRPDQKLAAEYKTNDNYEKWDKATVKELDELDELDRMSVDLHRLFTGKAETIRNQNLLSGSNMEGIRTLIEGDSEGERKAFVAFQEWFACLKDIWNGDRGKVRLYKGLKNSFLNAADALPAERQKSLNEQVKAFESIFYPVLASLEYRDWKQDDVALIDNIPFILTYSENAYMVIPYATGGNNEVFKNVAAPTVVNPDRILYLYLIESDKEIRDLRDSIPYVAEYMRKKQFKAAVEFIIAFTDAVSSKANDDFTAELFELGGERIKQIKHIKSSDIMDMSDSFKNYLKQRSSGKRSFAIEKNTTGLSRILQGTGFYNSFPNYQFDSYSMKFDSLSECDMLGYIRKSPYITVTDMAALKRSSSISSNQPEFFDDYKELWKKYCERSGIWKSLCKVLSEYAENADTIASFKKKSPRDKDTYDHEYQYIIPFTCSKSAEKVINFLKEKDIAEPESRITGFTTDSCKIVIVDRCGYRTEYDRLFANVYALMVPDAISRQLNPKSHEVNVVFDNLVVSDISISGNRSAELSGLMGYFKEKGYVSNLIISADGRMSFTYATRQIKELLTTAGKMLEVYTYHKVKELGRFDDVVSSFEIDWEETGVRSEFDCIMTKGFRTLFVECKARPDIEQDFYFKLTSLEKQFGINATAVLIADTKEYSYYDSAPVNDMQRKRGSMMNVVTIWKPDEINNIGHTLLKVINGTYVSAEE